MPVDVCGYVRMWEERKESGGTQRSYTHTPTDSHTHTHGAPTSDGFETGLK